MQNYIFVLDSNRNILDPCHPAVARKLQTQGKAKQLRRYPMTLSLGKQVENPNPQPLTLKIDPGSKVTGFALLNAKNEVVWVMELTHRGQSISASLLSRAASRRNRRNRKTRYRQARFLNRTRPEGWLAPSLMHRVLTIETWVKRLCRYANVTAICMELVRFDLQQMENPEISGVAYQQGELAGYEVREYLLEKWGRECAYCRKKDTPLEIEHIQPRSKNGSNRLSNLTLACHSCNQSKGSQDVKDFLSDKVDLLKRILSKAKQPLKDAAAVNSTRWKLFKTLKETGLAVGTGSGGQTKFNRVRLGLPKEHWVDAACVGKVEQLALKTAQPLKVKCAGHGNRQMAGLNKYGFPIRHRSRMQVHRGFQTGDIVKAVVTMGKKVGSYSGRVLCRASGSFDIQTRSGRVQGISHKYCSFVQKKDGYAYGF
jgi:5-methylcytosine-specific restriction endonuclease McrA